MSVRLHILTDEELKAFSENGQYPIAGRSYQSTSHGMPVGRYYLLWPNGLISQINPPPEKNKIGAWATEMLKAEAHRRGLGARRSRPQQHRQRLAQTQAVR